MYNVQKLYVVTYMCTIVGVYSCAVDANQCVRALRRVGCIGATVCEVRLNSETPTDSTAVVETTHTLDFPLSASCDVEPTGCAISWILLLMSAVAHAMHYCGGDECDSDDEGPNTMYS